MPGYPRWVRAVTFPVSCYRVVRVEARAPFAKGRLAVRRRTPRVPEGFSSGCRGRSLGPMARCLPTVGSHSKTSLPVSDTTQGVPSILLAWALAPYGLAHSRP